ncbi:MAG: lipopolysaccharide biosynthesis protein [Rhizobiaceae bacterium]
MATVSEFLAARAGLLRGYGSALSGSVGRLVFSLAYFILLANTLSIADFGIFATASATGVVLSRLLAFGFVSPLYRAATVKSRLIGVYAAGFIALGIVSLPLIAIVGFLVHQAVFAGDIGLAAFSLIMLSEVVLWRLTEAVIIVNNGMGRFGRAAILVILGTAFRAAAALAFAYAAARAVDQWAIYYLAANAVSLLTGIAFFYPGQRLRLKPALYGRRLIDSVAVSGAEVLFYLQMELDKLLVLAIGGPQIAGIYAIIMRLVDLTAIPIRVFTMMLMQAMMRSPDLLRRAWLKSGLEAGIFSVSVAALLTLAGILHIYPGLLGSNVAEAAPIIGFALLVPAFRNLVEYQAELLYARGQTVLRAINLALLAGAKAVLLVGLLSVVSGPIPLLTWLNAVFAVLYVISALLTYSALKRPAQPV